MYTKLLESETVPVWQVILILESYRTICSDGALSRSIFDSFDNNEHVANIFSEMSFSITKVIFEQRNYLPSLGEKSSENVETHMFSFQSSGVKIPL